MEQVENFNEVIFTKEDDFLIKVLKRTTFAQGKITELGAEHKKEKHALSLLITKQQGLVAGLQAKGIFKEICEIDKEIQKILKNLDTN